MTNNQNIGWNLENSYTSLPAIFFEYLDINQIPQPKLVLYNKTVGTMLGLNIEEMDKEKVAAYLSGQLHPEGSQPIAQSYAGHQFGNFTMLGDGRAKLIGEQITPEGKRIDVQLKGAGKTPYSRGGDGKATLGPMLREYIISEAMHGLGIPTTRGLAVVSTGESVKREKLLRGAILARTASSHLRVGTFQFAAAYGSLEDVKALADYAIERHDPELKNNSNPYLSFLEAVMQRQASLVAQWQLVGFIHGVMNTDNTTISGETIDYGPCAFMDRYHQKTVFSSIDLEGRYAYMNQPSIAAWNLARFAESLLPLLAKSKDEAVEQAQQAISQFTRFYQEYWLNGMRGKLGLFDEEKEDETLINDLLSIMQKYEADYTNTFLDLTYNTKSLSPFMQTEEYQKWYVRWKERQHREGKSEEDILMLLKQSNPAVIPRNQRVEEALEAALEQNDYRLIEKLLTVLEDPYAHSEEQKAFAELPVQEQLAYQTYCGT